MGYACVPRSSAFVRRLRFDLGRICQGGVLPARAVVCGSGREIFGRMGDRLS